MRLLTLQYNELLTEENYVILSGIINNQSKHNYVTGRVLQK